MKIVATIMSCTPFGAIESVSAIIEVEEEKLPEIVKDHLEYKQWAKDNGKNNDCAGMSLSFLEE
ncbi:MAG: hypothetical protein WC449_05375 [Candidatus Paceibacterota bacterium]